MVKTAQHITGTPLPAIVDLQLKRCLRRARGIIRDPSHPCHKLFALLPSGRLLVSNLPVMSYDRYISICYPLRYNSIMTPKIICGLILLSWLSSFFFIAIIISLSLRLQFCGNILDRLYCDNYSVVKLACSNTMLNNIWGLLVTAVYVSCTIFPTIYSYVRILQICLSLQKKTKQKAFNTCTPHIASMLNFFFGWLFVILQGRYETEDLPPILRTILFVYFLICPPIFNPFMYGIRMVKIRHACNKVLGLNHET
ncbi:LOW QUALITY PROTEIN: olfactory receptor 52N4 [Salmo salar]|uniref:LOW QUALITY PROTEIN: olfactory receptor 52N4 n=1 Tax=Salmo salar TaxID=8030 RepID=A0A1S3SZF3_SALSA|nr:LOW QUALITY PROTEIN: olfactory receptor 52N4 [Salmo salar]